MGACETHELILNQKENLSVDMKTKRVVQKFTDLVGIDCSTTATKVVRIKRNKDRLFLAGVDLLPPVDFKTPSCRLELPRNMVSHYGCLTYSGNASVIRMVNAPLQGDERTLPIAKLRELLNVGDDYRISADLVTQGKGRQDSSFLVAAIPEKDVRFLLDMFPSGPPALASVEVAGLSYIPAFLHARGSECADEVVCLIESGETDSYFTFLNKGIVTLVGKFSCGVKTLRSKIANDLGVDDELAGTILGDTSINQTATMIEVLTPFLKQISISKDFIERHQGCRVSKVYVSGGASLLPKWATLVGQVLRTDVESWSPFEGLQIDADVIPESLAGQDSLFAAAVGAAIGGLE